MTQKLYTLTCYVNFNAQHTEEIAIRASNCKNADKLARRKIAKKLGWIHKEDMIKRLDLVSVIQDGKND